METKIKRIELLAKNKNLTAFEKAYIADMLNRDITVGKSRNGKKIFYLTKESDNIATVVIKKEERTGWTKIWQTVVRTYQIKYS